MFCPHMYIYGGGVSATSSEVVGVVVVVETVVTAVVSVGFSDELFCSFVFTA